MGSTLQFYMGCQFYIRMGQLLLFINKGTTQNRTPWVISRSVIQQLRSEQCPARGEAAEQCVSPSVEEREWWTRPNTVTLQPPASLINYLRPCFWKSCTRSRGRMSKPPPPVQCQGPGPRRDSNLNLESKESRLYRVDFWMIRSFCWTSSWESV